MIIRAITEKLPGGILLDLNFGLRATLIWKQAEKMFIRGFEIQSFKAFRISDRIHDNVFEKDAGIKQRFE